MHSDFVGKNSSRQNVPKDIDETDKKMAGIQGSIGSTDPAGNKTRIARPVLLAKLARSLK
jgi:hypothetical protein